MRKERTWQEHIEMLKQLSQHTTKELAQKYEISESAMRGWIWRLNKKIAETQTALNIIRNLQKNDKRIRKFTTNGALPNIEEGEY